MTLQTLERPAGPLDPAHRTLLAEAVDHVECGAPEEARQALERLARTLDLERTEHQLAYLLAAGLARRIAGQPGDSNLYQQSFDVPHVELFYLLKARDPLFVSTYPVANQQLARFIRGQEAVTVLDFGTGDGAQLETLVEDLAATGGLPRRMDFVGVDLFEEGLRVAGRRLEEAGRRHASEIRFHPLARMVEEMEEPDWDLVARCEGSVVVNATFALHHLRHTSARPDARDTLFARLYALEPRGLVMCEPCADFNVPGLRERLRHAARFFGAMFRHIDTLDIGLDDKRILKFVFWGREVLDILGNGEVGRCERYETPHSWVSRLRRAGFAAAGGLEQAAALAHPALRVTTNEGFVGLGTEEETLIAVIVASGDDPVVPARAPAGRAVSSRDTALARRLGALDVPGYLRLLASVARANGMVHVRERDFVDGQARLAGLDPGSLWSGALEAPDEPWDVPEATRDAVVRDCLALAWVDGEYDLDEQAAVHRVAARLGIDDSRLAALESAARHLSPPLLEGGPAWFRDYWMLQEKRTP